MLVCYCLLLVNAPQTCNNSKFTKEQEMFLQISQQMACNIISIKTDCSVKNVHISQFQNPLQTKFNLHISLSLSNRKNQPYPETLYYILYDSVYLKLLWKSHRNLRYFCQTPIINRQFQKIGMQGEHIRFRSRLKF